jgi:F-type H+-transporting ATPase subunit gamma
MATLREIRAKLGSVQNIKKITQALEMVAASRLRKALAKAESSRPYARILCEVLKNILTSTDSVEHALITPREVKKVGFVVIAADRGLCGSYNQAVFSVTEKELEKYDPAKVELVLIGRKTVEHFQGKKWPVIETIPEWGGKITYAQIEALTLGLIDRFLEEKLDEIWIIYNHYINLSARQVLVEKLLNIDPDSSKGEGEKVSTNYIFEPSMDEVFVDVLPRYCITKVQTALYEAYAAELASRILSMRAATTNAEEMIEELTLVRNKVRQTSITREIIEITAGVESLK